MSIDSLFDWLQAPFRITHTAPKTVLAVYLVITLLAAWSASHLYIDNDFSHLIPSDYPSVEALTELRERFGAESDVAVLIESPSFEANRAFADTLVAAALRLRNPDAPDSTEYFKSVDYRREVGFMKSHALYFATNAELDSLTAYLERQARKARLEANPFYFELDDEVEADDATLTEMQELYDELVTSEYRVSQDSTRLLIRLFPTGTQTDLAFIDAAYTDLRELTQRLNPSAYHPEMQVELGGRLQRQLIEVRAILNDVTGSFGAGVLTLLVLVTGYFFYKRIRLFGAKQSRRQVIWSEMKRMPWTAVILGLPLLSSLAWTYGVVYLAYDHLNLMTSTLSLILFGLGIDFGIHFYARYLEERGKGRPVASALDHTFMTTGRAITVVALTTAGGFFVLVLADFKGFSQFGFTAGIGTIFALLSMLVLLPALLAFLEQQHWLPAYSSLDADGARRLTTDGRHSARRHQENILTETPVRRDSDGEGDTPPQIRDPIHRWIGMSSVKRKMGHLNLTALTILLLSLLGVAAAGSQLPEVQFEYDFGELEPRYEEYEAFKDRTRDLYSSSSTRNAAYILADSPTHAEEIADVLRRRAASDTSSPTIRAVETIYDRFPARPEAKTKKLERIANVRGLLDDRFLKSSDDENLERLRQAASTREPLTLDQIPSFIKSPFLTREGTVGDIVIVYPSVGLADGRNSMAFADDVQEVTLTDGTTYHAASTSIVASDMLRLMIDEAPLMVVLTVFLIIIFKLIALRRVLWVAVALVPLIASFLWMFGLMGALGLKLNFFNLVVLPTILGIGDDSGIHLVHRYLEEGRGSIRRVLTSTGEHVTMSAVTTMIGFGGLLLSMHPGLRSIGALAVLGISMTLLAAMISLPALLVWLEWKRTPATPSTPEEAEERASTIS
ncbi:transporter [Longibacter salinarum]|uniref:Transporter n=1 Tax=Longibacter salinarum TaxID=1850348 RepID=A0A2A8CWF2_9BACT|nr:MMPL family transporter [Longibacter salinarum]PEN12924.1 transporter [Longibacter salinarum]